MTDKALVRQSARELARLIRTRALSPVEVLDAYLDVIEALNPKLNAVVTLAADQAREAAKRAEATAMKGESRPAARPADRRQGRRRRTAGIRTTFGSPLFGYVLAEDAEAVRRLKAAGAVVPPRPTRRNSPRCQHHQRVFGPTRNPWNPALSPGRLVRRVGGCGRHRHGADRARHRLSAVRSASRRVLRHRRHPPDAGTDRRAIRWHCPGIRDRCTDRSRATPRMRRCCSTR